MIDQPAARPGEPHIPAVPPAIQFSAALVLGDEGYEGAENLWHGPERIPQPQ
jgi:hypothetical protein